MKLKHPDSKQTIDVATDQAGIYVSQGWQRVRAQRSSSSDTKSASKTTADKGGK